jgi:nucleotide-binding universal stress UspA family protein
LQVPDSTDQERMPTVPLAPATRPHDPRSTVELVRGIASDSSTLMRKEVELAKQEILEAVTARMIAAGALAAAGLFAVFVLGFLGLAAGAALATVMSAWAAALIVAGGYALLAVPAVLFGIRKMKAPPMAPEQTKRTVKEDVEWARAQLKR